MVFLFPPVTELIFLWVRQTVRQYIQTRVHSESEDSDLVRVWHQFQCVWFLHTTSNSPTPGGDWCGMAPGVGGQAQTPRARAGLVRHSIFLLGAIGRHCRILGREVAHFVLF